MIKQLDSLPAGLLELTANKLYTKIKNHTLVHLKGKIEQPIFISILQHGDEYTGWDALKDYLNNHQRQLPRSMTILFGNIQAARFNVRQLDNQPDFNRSWPSYLNLDDPVANTMRNITDIMALKKPFASVDIHNNSGRNPHYSGVNSLNQEFLNLASLFSDTMIYFTTPVGIQSGAFAEFCPSVTVECGLSGASDGRKQTHTFLELLFNRDHLKTVPGNIEYQSEHQRVFKIHASVKIKPEISIGFQQDNSDFELTKDLDVLNFQQIEEGEVFGKLNKHLHDNQVMPFIVMDQNENIITDQYFKLVGNEVCCKSPFVPAMITQNIQAIRHDCLCYIMQPINVAIS
ncbi:MAG: M14 family metallopeptidase [Proteobacteria bacterium]|nr:M14 family metallopeptidase [Pseudomonadota bacterium]